MVILLPGMNCTKVAGRTARRDTLCNYTDLWARICIPLRRNTCLIPAYLHFFYVSRHIDHSGHLIETPPVTLIKSYNGNCALCAVWRIFPPRVGCFKPDKAPVSGWWEFWQASLGRFLKFFCANLLKLPINSVLVILLFVSIEIFCRKNNRTNIICGCILLIPYIHHKFLCTNKNTLHYIAHTRYLSFLIIW